MKIFVTRKIPGDHLQKLKDAGSEVVVSLVDRILTPEELIENVKGVDAILSLLTDKIDAKVMDSAGQQLKIISNYAVGFDNIDLDAAKSRNIKVTNTPSDEVNESVAEHTWALILSITRRIVEADEAVRRGAYNGWEPNIFLGQILSGKTLGILGLGRIGSMVAKRAIGFGMRVLYFNRSRDEEVEKELGVSYIDMNNLLANSDVVTIHLPLTSETRHLINKNTLNRFKKGAYLVNTARGSIVDEHELAEFLRSGQLAGVAMDVFDNEPYLNPELIGMSNVILTPHIASATIEAREKMGEMAVQAILDCLAGKEPINLVK